MEYTVIYCKIFADWTLQSKEMEPVCVKIPCSLTEEMVLSLVYFQLSPGNFLLISIPLVSFYSGHTQLTAVSQHTMPAFPSSLQLSYFHPPLKFLPFHSHSPQIRVSTGPMPFLCIIATPKAQVPAFIISGTRLCLEMNYVQFNISIHL